MAVAPSSNLLSALSQLQGTRSAAPTQAPRNSQSAASASGPAATQSTSFAAQLSSVSNAIQVGASQERAPAQQAAAQTQAPRPIPTRGGYLGQHVNIVV